MICKLDPLIKKDNFINLFSVSEKKGCKQEQKFHNSEYQSVTNVKL